MNWYRISPKKHTVKYMCRKVYLSLLLLLKKEKVMCAYNHTLAHSCTDLWKDTHETNNTVRNWMARDRTGRETYQLVFFELYIYFLCFEF